MGGGGAIKPAFLRSQGTLDLKAGLDGFTIQAFNNRFLLDVGSDTCLSEEWTFIHLADALIQKIINPIKMTYQITIQAY